MSLYLRVLSYLSPYKGLLVGGVLATFLFAATDAFSLITLIPFLNSLFGAEPTSIAAANDSLRWLLDNTVGHFISDTAAPQQALISIILFMLGVFFLKNIMDWAQQVLVVRLEQKVTRDMRNEVYDHLVDLDLRFFGHTRAGQVITRLTSDVDRLRTLVTRNIAKFTTSIFEILATVALMITISWQLTLIALVALPAMFGIWLPLLRRLRRGDRRVLDLAGEVASHIQETVFGIRLVKSFAAERYERDRFHRLSHRYYRTFVRTDAMRAAAGPLTETMAAIGTVLLLWFGSRLVFEAELTAPAFITFLVLSTKLYSPAKWLSKFRSIIGPGLAAAERVFEFLDAPIEISQQIDAMDFPGEHDTIRFEHVTFGYDPVEPVLEDIDFEVRRGEVVALVGPSGAGKSTLVDLLARFYDPTGGRILIDDVDIRRFSTRSLRSRFGIVTQETVLFHDTVRSNIAYGLPNASQESIERAADAAHASEFIRRLPEGYETVLGERGTRLSGGQRQRIAIARAILRDPPILIFDEATSALDTESERLVQEAINRLLQGRTVFVIAHRLSTIRHADRILVLKNGRLVESGRHEELLDRRGTYRQLYEMQFASA
ncbi:MAG TPA: ABC transporter ATP-binding protein [Longimicrobiales bacterium]|nr:ABC transporter ATP-binding protein [Longimicrobiales bacterium]